MSLQLILGGSGSGKTTSLIKGLSSAIRIHGEKLKKTRQAEPVHKFV